ncbi:hypothetical protein AURANDRAFT_19109, partial [Aureococcus anophagefferens]
MAAPPRPPPPRSRSPPPPPLPSRTSRADDGSVANADMEHLIPLVNKLQDALALSSSANEISLPQIAVVGGQSSGKSSVLENIVGKSFLPRGSGIVTRRPLVLQLVNGPDEWGEFLHAPGKKFYDFEAIREEIDADTARVCGSNKGLDGRAIHLKVSSPHVLNLTLIDLPGSTKVPVGDQPDDIGDQIQEMILRYVVKPTCIILAVTPANADLANSDALQIARSVDPTGDRALPCTLGVLTKLDLMDRGTSARDVFTGASGDVPRLKLGYVGVVNRSQADINEKKSIHDARAFERDYFAKSDAYRDLAPTLGTAHLVSRCSELLVQHIRVSLPTLERELAESLAAKRKKLSDFGDQTPDAKRRKLTEALLHFCDRYAALISGAPLPHGGGAHATDELRGGARIEAVFRDVFAAEVDRVAVLDDLSPGEVQTLVRNVHGLGGGLFTPDQAFVQLVQRNVRRLARPATRCVELVHAELVKLVDVAGDFEGIAVFPALRGGLAEIVNGKLRDALDAADATLRTLVDMELARINITHPDFVG